VPRARVEEARVHVPGALRRVRARGLVALDQHLPKGSRQPEPAHPRTGSPRHVGHSPQGHRTDHYARHQKVRAGQLAVRAQDGGPRHHQGLQVRRRHLGASSQSLCAPRECASVSDSASTTTYVRSLDPERKDELVDCIEILLGDNTTLVLGSTIAAFSEVCPERLDIIHPHYRKLCNMLADTDEWGQIYILTLLTRYARTQFANPNADHPVRAKKSTKFYSDDESGSSDDDATTVVEPGEIDPDHLLLLRAALPLLQSRNTGVRTRTASRVAPRSSASTHCVITLSCS